MEQTLPIAKLSQPFCGQVLERKRLFSKLDDSLKHPVTWITGPAGAGKTTLVLSYFAKKRTTPLWFQVDEGDRDPAAFFYHLSLLAQQIAIKHHALLQLTQEYLDGLSVFARNFLRQFYSCLPDQSVLIFDNFQQAEGENALDAILPILLSEIPPGIRVIILNRSLPPDDLVRLQSSGYVQTIDSSQLFISEQEIRGLVRKQYRGLTLSRHAIEKLFTRSQGWASGLILMLEQAFDERETPTFLQGEPNEIIFSYFASELFKNLDEEEKSFLLKTAILQNIDVDVAKKLTGNTDSKKILQNLVRRNYFTNKRSSVPPNFEYHPLYREFLLSHLEENEGEDNLNEMRARAADLLIEKHEVKHAAELYRQVGQTGKDHPAGLSNND